VYGEERIFNTAMLQLKFAARRESSSFQLSRLQSRERLDA
jgi:hypothetical protein